MAEIMIETSASAAYEALDDGAALLVRVDSGVLQVSDNDRQDFLHRMTTNEINGIRAGQSTVTILTSPTARTLFAFTVVVRADDMLLLPSADEADALARHLRGQIFFMDAVKLVDVSDEWTRMRLMGSRANELLATLGIDLDDTVDDAWAEKDGIHVVKQARYDVPGYEILAPAADADGLIARLVDAGAVLSDHNAYEIRRVELGRPKPAAELVESYNPLESGMAWVCAGDKGCYTGQEIIARQITYDKVNKTLVGLRGEASMEVGAEVLVDGRSVGNVTSAAYSPALDAHLALVVIKRPANEVGVQVVIDGQRATVQSLPFLER